MDLLFDISWELFPFLLMLSAIIGITAILRVIFKRKITAYATAIILVIGTAYIIDRSHYTTFTDIYSDYLNAESVVREVTVSPTYLPDDRRFDPDSEIEIEDEEMMNEIMQEFSQLELKRDREHHYIENPDYRVHITTTNEEEEGLLRTESFYFHLDDEYLNSYKIVNDTNYLEVLDDIVECENRDRE